MPVADPFAPSSGSSTVNQKIQDLTGDCNGSRQQFTVSSAYKTSLLQIYWNGILQTSTEITEDSQTQFSTSFTPAAGDNLVAIYIEN